MQSKFITALFASILGAIATPAFADQTVTLNVPVNMSNIPSSITYFSLVCYLGIPGGINQPRKFLLTPITGGSFNATVQMPVVAPTAVIPTLDGTYGCEMGFYGAGTTATTTAAGLTTTALAPLIATPQSGWQISGRLWPAVRH